MKTPVQRVKNNSLIAGFILALAFILQALLIWALLKEAWIESIILHTLSALLFPWPLWLYLPQRFKTNRLIILLFGFLCALIPLVAGPGFCLALLICSRFTKSIDPLTFNLFAPPIIPDNIIDALAYTNTYAGNIRAVLEASTGEQLRIQAVLATRKMSDKIAIPILQIALLDTLDEVRLLAYSMLNSKEKKISSDIQQNLTRLKNQSLSAKKKTLIQGYIAEAYWELAYLGLEQGQARLHVLETARHYAEAATAIFQTDAELFFLQGRIALELGDFSASNQLFIRAQQLNLSENKILPYLAELAFAEHRMHDVRTYLLKLQYADEHFSPKDMINQWL